jgi:hypothetical protein
MRLQLVMDYNLPIANLEKQGRIPDVCVMVKATPNFVLRSKQSEKIN